MNLPPETPPSSPSATPARRSRMRRLLQPIEGQPDIFSREQSFAPPIGRHLDATDRPRGYYIDFSVKAVSPTWPPEWLAAPDRQLHVASVQWALAAWERYLGGDGEAWRKGTLDAAEHLISIQQIEGAHEGAWLQWFPMPHTYRIDPPWPSAITQGEAASLFARLHFETGEEHFAEAARRALRPMRIPISAGGLAAEIDGLPIFEEYPTQPSSHVLNGAVFALWGFYDVAKWLDDAEAEEWYEGGLQGLISILDRYDTGYWSRYDLYPHPVANIASSAYHFLHINQLDLLNRLSPRPELDRVRSRFEAYRESPGHRARAFVQKVGFRTVSPRNKLLAQRLPWNKRFRRRRELDVVVLCYHAVSENWPAALAVTPEALSAQVRYLLDLGYEAITFSEAVLAPQSSKRFAVTFDDAYASVRKRAAPILKDLGIPGTVFVATAFQDRSEPMSWPGTSQWLGGPHDDELRPLGWDGLRQLAESGWEVGSHTHTHPRLTELSDAELLSELRQSRLECERRLGRPCLSLAYPYGDYDPRVVRAAAEAGYANAAGLSSLDREGTAFSYPRIGVYDIDTPRRFRMKLSRTGRRLGGSRLGPMLTRLSRLATGRARAPS